MILRAFLDARPQSTRLRRILGIGIFAVAFLLPACKFGGGRSELIQLGTYSGWKCAEMSLMLVVAVESYHSPFILAVLGGLINPMILAYLAAFNPRFARLRRILSWSILFCMISTWAFFAIDQFVPLVGHFFWVLGIGLILSDQFAPTSEGTAN